MAEYSATTLPNTATSVKSNDYIAIDKTDAGETKKIAGVDLWTNESGNMAIYNESHGDNIIVTTETAGGSAFIVMTGDPDTSRSYLANDCFSVQCQAGSVRLDAMSAAASDLYVRNLADGKNVYIQADNAGGTTVTLATFDPDTVTTSLTAVSLGVVNISATSGTTNVQGKGVVTVDTSGGNVDIQGFTNGVTGQPLEITRSSTANTLTIRNNHASGTQKILCDTNADIAIANYGGCRLVFTGTYWKMTGKAVG